MVNYNDSEDAYVYKEKIGNQTFFMEFQVRDWTDDTTYFNICMGVYNKRKHAAKNEDEARITGKDPFKTCLCAMKAFNELERYVIAEEKAKFPNKKIHISCSWVDNRRRDVYYKFLSKRGYRYGVFENQKVIYKTF